MKTQNKKFVVIGGGTGTFSVLSGLKLYTDQITAIVTMADSGGSAKKERDEWGLLPSSDIRKSLLALSNVSTRNALLLRRLFKYRYDEGEGIKGMTFGNLFLVALTKLLGSQSKAIEKAGEILKIKGKVLPVTMNRVDLVAEYKDGTRIVGEHFIDEPDHDGKISIKKLYTLPAAKINPEAEEAINEADVIIIGPGGFYTTILANLVIKGIPEAIMKSHAIKIYIMNLMTEYGQTYKFTAGKFLSELGKYIPLSALDFILLNSAPIPKPILRKYHDSNTEPVINDIRSNGEFKVIAEDILSPRLINAQKGDSLQRSFVRHDGKKIADICFRILNLI